MYFYATSKTEVYRRHLLCDTPLIQRLVLPYLERGAAQAASLQCHADSYGRGDFKKRAKCQASRGGRLRVSQDARRGLLSRAADAHRRRITQASKSDGGVAGSAFVRRRARPNICATITVEREHGRPGVGPGGRVEGREPPRAAAWVGAGLPDD